jgi:RNA polymerase sigma factor (sigma-70 family)
MTYHKVRNSIKHHQRGRRDVRRERANDPDEGAAFAETTPGPEDVVILSDCLEQLIGELPVEYRQIVTLRLEGNTIAEIAKAVAYSQRTVLRVLSNVQAQVVKQLESAQ